MESPIIIPMDSNTIDYLQYVHTQLEGFKNIVSDTLMKATKYEYNKENYEYFMEQYQEMNYKYNVLTQELLNTHAPQYIGSKDHEMTFDFNKKELTITKVEVKKGGACNVCRA